ncbi:MAG TPA: PssE/Cps14G family polysaccharide biosynthesis glycosyltransferase [archaeon]|nr:PssE/Cps14G family polysaccharide biosynthesis glycosyltransferase [archaeon]
MIFATVGTHNQQFDRLLKELDRLVERKIIKDKIVAQIGNSTYKPKNYDYFAFTSWQRILRLNKTADVVVSHGGAGNLLLAAHFGKPIVVVPRMKKLGEHVDDHQLQLVRQLEREKRVVGVYDIGDLGNAIKKAKILTMRKRKERREKKIVAIVRDYIEQIAKEKG